VLIQESMAKLPVTRAVQIVDATSLSVPGSVGTDYLVHLSLNLGSQGMVEAKLTEVSQGEGFSHFTFSPGTLVIADRNYGRPRDIAKLQEQDVDVIVRMKCSHNGIRDLQGGPFTLLERLGGLKTEEVGDFPVQLFSEGKCVSKGRLIAVEQTEEATQRAVKKIKRKAQRNSRNTGLNALEAAHYIFVFTTLPEETHSPEQILQLYRLRWEVELSFKRLKSLIALDDLPMKDPNLCRSFLTLKLIAALLIEKLIARALSFSPEAQAAPVTAVGMLQSI